MGENRAAARRFVACYELFVECQRREESGAGSGECRPGHAVLDPIDVAAGYVVSAMAISTGRAERMITFALDLHLRYPAILSAMAQGRLDLQAAKILASQMATVHVDVLEAVQRQVVEEYLAAIEGGVRMGEKAIRGNVDAIIARYDANGIRLCRQEAARTRGVRFHKGVDGMSSVSAILATEEAAVLAEALDQRVKDHKYADAQAAANTQADTANPDTNTGTGGSGEVEDYSIAERRADALMSLVCGDPGLAGNPARPGGTGGVALRPKVTVIATGNHARDAGGARVEFTRSGQAALQALLDMLATSDGATFEPIDPRIGAADDSRAALKYRPGAQLARRIRLRDGTCRHPGCAVPAEACDLDHVVPFDHADPQRGGHTIEANLAAMCRRHHRFKTFSEWIYDLQPDGTLIVRTPDGTTMLTRPSGPLAEYRREQARAETEAWTRQQRRSPGPTGDEQADAEPTFWSRRAARHRTERRNAERARTFDPTPPAPGTGTGASSSTTAAATDTTPEKATPASATPESTSRWWARNKPHHSDIEKGIRALLHERLDELIDPPPF
ncbi:HNH endonuclease signature motif containing protein [Dietzia kunjamensis]|uniref:HNH endonuclease signature motif containing protein n=1 Tax=Dietzia kunjamensis TaxID=322509 RepID=UPI0020969C6C|nr:HNH endonuclease signature motif containing protein [Dietzia kunjamensis]USX45134.1 HNH endonuclease [Dietzia kunjamensis]